VSDETLTIEAEPLTLSVPLGEALRETDLMAALEFVVEHWRYSVRHDEEISDPEIARAVSWLSEKYGTP
jgi:hypothetical protein